MHGHGGVDDVLRCGRCGRRLLLVQRRRRRAILLLLLVTELLLLVLRVVARRCLLLLLLLVVLLLVVAVCRTRRVELRRASVAGGHRRRRRRRGRRRSRSRRCVRCARACRGARRHDDSHLHGDVRVLVVMMVMVVRVRVRERVVRGRRGRLVLHVMRGRVRVVVRVVVVRVILVRVVHHDARGRGQRARQPVRDHIVQVIWFNDCGLSARLVVVYVAAASMCVCDETSVCVLVRCCVPVLHPIAQGGTNQNARRRRRRRRRWIVALTKSVRCECAHRLRARARSRDRPSERASERAHARNSLTACMRARARVSSCGRSYLAAAAKADVCSRTHTL